MEQTNGGNSCLSRRPNRLDRGGGGLAYIYIYIYMCVCACRIKKICVYTYIYICVCGNSPQVKVCDIFRQHSEYKELPEHQSMGLGGGGGGGACFAQDSRIPVSAPNQIISFNEGVYMFGNKLQKPGILDSTISLSTLIEFA